MKICYFDVETTGLDPVKHDIIEIACIIEIDNVVKDEFSLLCQPFKYGTIDEGALKSCGTTIEELRDRMLPQEMYSELIKYFSKHIDKYNKLDKFYPAGFNVRFDVDMLNNFYQKNDDKYYGSWFNWKTIDPLPMLNWLDVVGEVRLEKRNLETACEYFKIDMGKAHVALNDIKATRELIRILMNRFFN